MDHRAEGRTRSVAGPTNRLLHRLARWHIGVVLWAMLLASFLYLGFRWNHVRYRQSALKYLQARNAVLEFEHARPLANWFSWSRVFGEDAAIRLHSIDLSHANASDVDLSLVAAFEELVRLNLQNGNVTDESAIYIRKLTNLESLNLAGTLIRDKGIAQLTSAKLTDLDLSETAISDTAVEQIAKWTLLNRLHLRSISASDASLSRLSRLSQLVELDLSHTSAAAETLRSLGGHAQLKILYLASCPLSDDHLEFLANSSSIEHLSLQGTQVGDVGISRLSENRSLTKLVLSSTRATDRSLQALRPMNKLKVIEAENTEISPSALEQFHNRHSKQRKPMPTSGANSAYLFR